MTIKPKSKSEATKARILEAAATKFSQKGYDNTSTREIGELAEANIGLLNRYFGSKEELFRQAILSQLTLLPVLEGDPAGLAGRLGEISAQKSKQSDTGVDIMMAILRSIGSEAVGPIIQEILTTKVTGEVQNHLKGNNVEARAAMVVAITFGVEAVFRTMQVFSEKNIDTEQVTEMVTDIISRVVEPQD
ncbi:TetR/AcrR family transcriptional regulator [Ruegeria sp. SCP11]|uniref:TetR/AcrR family transcriptional regulator n=1 Tax=Ruegeria sp. SCP11 TaxID=3141378 RepID=UPI00333C6674